MGLDDDSDYVDYGLPARPPSPSIMQNSSLPASAYTVPPIPIPSRSVKGNSKVEIKTQIKDVKIKKKPEYSDDDDEDDVEIIDEVEIIEEEVFEIDSEPEDFNVKPEIKIESGSEQEDDGDDVECVYEKVRVPPPPPPVTIDKKPSLEELEARKEQRKQNSRDRVRLANEKFSRLCDTDPVASTSTSSSFSISTSNLITPPATTSIPYTSTQAGIVTQNIPKPSSLSATQATPIIRTSTVESTPSPTPATNAELLKVVGDSPEKPKKKAPPPPRISDRPPTTSNTNLPSILIATGQISTPASTSTSIPNHNNISIATGYIQRDLNLTISDGDGRVLHQSPLNLLTMPTTIPIPVQVIQAGGPRKPEFCQAGPSLINGEEKECRTMNVDITPANMSPPKLPPRQPSQATATTSHLEKEAGFLVSVSESVKNRRNSPTIPNTKDTSRSRSPRRTKSRSRTRSRSPHRSHRTRKNDEYLRKSKKRHSNHERHSSAPAPKFTTPEELVELLKKCYKCPHLVFKERQNALKHMKDEHNMKYCPVCFNLYSCRKNDWKNHLNRRHALSQGVEMATCPIRGCNMSFHFEGLYPHIGKMHLVPLERNRKKKSQSNGGRGSKSGGQGSMDLRAVEKRVSSNSSSQKQKKKGPQPLFDFSSDSETTPSTSSSSEDEVPTQSTTKARTTLNSGFLTNSKGTGSATQPKVTDSAASSNSNPRASGNGTNVPHTTTTFSHSVHPKSSNTPVQNPQKLRPPRLTVRDSTSDSESDSEPEVRKPPENNPQTHSRLGPASKGSNYTNVAKPSNSGTTLPHKQNPAQTRPRYESNSDSDSNSESASDSEEKTTTPAKKITSGHTTPLPIQVKPRIARTPLPVSKPISEKKNVQPMPNLQKSSGSTYINPQQTVKLTNAHSLYNNRKQTFFKNCSISLVPLTNQKLQLHYRSDPNPDAAKIAKIAAEMEVSVQYVKDWFASKQKNR